MEINSNSPAMSEDIRSLASGMMQATFTATGLDGDNSFQKYKYAKLGSIYKAVKGALKDQGIWVTHFKRPHDTGIEYMYTRLTHAPTGQYIEDCRIVESEKPGNQGKGSADTYMKKQALLSLCAITAEEDDDGQSEREVFITDDQLEYLEKLLDSCSNAKEIAANILSHYKIKNLSYVKSELFSVVKTYIEKSRK